MLTYEQAQDNARADLLSLKEIITAAKVELDEAYAELERAYDTLARNDKELDRAIFEAKSGHLLTYRDIGDTLGIKDSAAFYRCRRHRDRLGKQ